MFVIVIVKNHTLSQYKSPQFFSDFILFIDQNSVKTPKSVLALSMKGYLAPNKISLINLRLIICVF